MERRERGKRQITPKLFHRVSKDCIIYIYLKLHTVHRSLGLYKYTLKQRIIGLLREIKRSYVT